MKNKKKPPPLRYGGSNSGGPPMIGSHRRTFLRKLPMRCVPNVMPCFWLAERSICTPPISLLVSFPATIYTASERAPRNLPMVVTNLHVSHL